MRLSYADPEPLTEVLTAVARLQDEGTIALAPQVVEDVTLRPWQTREFLGLAVNRGLLLGSGGARTKGYRLTAEGRDWLEGVRP